MAKKIPEIDLSTHENFKRNENGLLEGVEYKFKPNGTIDWRAMVKPEHTVINLQYKAKLEQEFQKRIEDINVSELEDKYLLVLLAGFKELALLRGYEGVSYNVPTATRDYVAAICRIGWIPNYETNGKILHFESMADASIDTTSGFGSKYLMAMAENRAFVRCVRNSLGIHVVGADEIGPMNFMNAPVIKTFSPTEPHGVLENKLKTRSISFGQFKEKWLKLGHKEADSWNDLSDIPSEQIYVILEAISKKDESSRLGQKA